ncbi:zinc finger protein 25-like [Protopterus annectens]|uniref:zinc finger protein 25-like n=1 Tax=Protopterus annectens TaxID=7888 RepID=UPI001CFB4EF7|nr:zinc finger protein 25-like [Protopterus annectens]
MKLEVPETFEDVAVDFSREEWKILTTEEKELYKEVMSQNYEYMVSLGYNIPKEKLLLLIEKHKKLVPDSVEGAEPLPYMKIWGDPTSICRDTSPCQTPRREHPGCDHGKSLSCHVTRQKLIPTGSTHKKHMENDRNFSQESELVIHTGEEQCKLATHDNSSVWQRHITYDEATYAASKPYKCPTYTSLRKQDNLTSFEETQSVEKTHKCGACGKRFLWKSLLKYHERAHTDDRPYKCTKCDWSFKQKKTLVSHETTHTEEKRYRCAVCGKSYTQKYNLQRHEKRHSGEKPCKCATCDRSFLWKKSFMGQGKSHTGAKNDCTESSKLGNIPTRALDHDMIGIPMKDVSSCPQKELLCHTRGVEKIKWTVEEKKEIMYCFYYATNREFPHRGYITRTRKKLEERKIIAPEKLLKTTDKNVMALIERIRAKQYLDKETLGGLEKDAIQEVVQEKEQKPESIEVHKKEAWTWERKRDLIWCHIYAEKKAVLTNMTIAAPTIFEDVYRQRNPDMVNFTVERIRTQKWNVLTKSKFSDVEKHQIESEVAGQLRREGFSADSLMQTVSPYEESVNPQKMGQQT